MIEELEAEMDRALFSGEWDNFWTGVDYAVTVMRGGLADE